MRGVFVLSPTESKMPTEIEMVAGRYLHQQLTQIDDVLYDTEYEDFWGANGLYHPARARLNIGAKQIAAARVDFANKAAIYSGRASDIPLLSINKEGEAFKTRIIIFAAEYTIFDLYDEAMANQNNAGFGQTNITEEITEGLRFGIDRRLHEVVWAGDKRQGLDGLYSGAGVSTTTLVDNLMTMSPRDLLEFMVNLVSNYRRRTKLTAKRIVMHLPTMLLGRLTIPIADLGGETVYSRLQSSDRGAIVSGIEEINELQSEYLEEYEIHAPGTNLDRIAIGPYDDERAVTRWFAPMIRNAPMLGDDGITWRIVAFCATSEMQYRQTYKFEYFDFPKAL